VCEKPRSLGRTIRLERHEQPVARREYIGWDVLSAVSSNYVGVVVVSVVDGQRVVASRTRIRRLDIEALEPDESVLRIDLIIDILIITSWSAMKPDANQR